MSGGTLGETLLRLFSYLHRNVGLLVRVEDDFSGRAHLMERAG
jgi:hypothetical protein